MNPLLELKRLGQSVWLDDIRRGWLNDGTLARLIREDGLAGVTSNPAIFEKAIAEGADYNEVIDALARSGSSAQQIYETLVLEDIKAAADLFRGTYDATSGSDGFVSLEVSPLLADDTVGTLHEARRLWQALDRPNVMIKVPGTKAGLPAIRTLLSEGINVNITLLFGLERYREVVEAFLSGLEQAAAAGLPVAPIASVASFFLSRIDGVVDPKLDTLGTPQAKALRGQAAIASAQLAYAIYQEWTTSPRWQTLAALGAQPQRLLWASTSTKDPAYPDTKYVETLIGPQTVNTLPPKTIEAYRDHGNPAVRILENIDQARQVPPSLKKIGIDLQAVSVELERDGVRKFVEPFEKLNHAIEARVR